MARSEQRNDKANKKPKKDSGSSSKDSSSSSVSTRPVAPTTAVLPKGKLKKKLG